jgi:hypothetical protein
MSHQNYSDKEASTMQGGNPFYAIYAKKEGKWGR